MNKNENKPKLEQKTPNMVEDAKKLAQMEKEHAEMCDRYDLHKAVRDANLSRKKELEDYEKNLLECETDLKVLSLRLMMVANSTENLALKARSLEIAGQVTRANYDITCGLLRQEFVVEKMKCDRTVEDAEHLMDETTEQICELTREISAIRKRCGLSKDDPIPDANVNDNDNQN